MTNTISIWLALLIGGFLVWDYATQDWQTTLFLGRKLLDLIEWLAFWR